MKKTYSVVAIDGSWEVRKYRGSLGFQIWVDGSFFVFVSEDYGSVEANRVLASWIAASKR